MTPSILNLGWRMLVRDARAGELRLLAFAVVLAVAALTAVGFFSDRIQGGLMRDARQLLGGDAVIVSDQALTPELALLAQAPGLVSAQTLSFPTMARASDERGGASRLVALKSIAPGYPLRGRLMLKDVPAVNATVSASAGQVPGPQEVWADAALLDALGLELGDTLLLGDVALTIRRLIVSEPDRGAGFMNFAPRVMVSDYALARSGLVQPASRITWRLAVAGDDATVRRFVQTTERALAVGEHRGVRLETLEAGRPEMRQTLDRAGRFLNLVALLAALLSAVAVALAARAFAARHLDQCAMLRVLGLRQRTMAGAYAMEFLLVGCVASLVGVGLGWAMHHVFVWLLSGLVDSAALPMAGVRPALLGLGLGMTLLVAFGLPPVLQLARVPPLRVIRRDVGGLKPTSVAVMGLGLAGFAALLWLASDDKVLGSIAVGGFAVAALLFAGVAWVALRVLVAVMARVRAVPQWLALATRQLAARPVFAVVQVSSLAVGLLALVLLVLLRTDLIDSWRQASPATAANRFAINIQPDQSEAFQALLQQSGVADFDFYPMIRGRLIAVNDREVRVQDQASERAKRLLDREFNLSHAAALPTHNNVTEGRWVPEEPDGLSVEVGLAQTLGLKLGDHLRFDIAGMPVEGRITSLRKVDWSSMRANFFVMFPRSQMPDVPVSYMSAYRAPSVAGFDHALVRQFPNVTSVDMSAALTQVQAVLTQVSRAVEYLFGFTLAAGLVVLFAAVSATRDDRAREYAIMRALGAGSLLLRRVQRAELMGVGALAGAMASVVASAVGWALAHWVFEFDWVVSVWTLVWGMLAGAVLAWLGGWWGLRGVLTRPVVATLRQYQS
jgi:putative ABC transport system permease protein